MSNYNFRTDKFALSDKSLHYLRGGFNFDTLDFILIDEFIIDRGPQINNWLIALIIGLSLMVGPVYVIYFSVLKGEIHSVGMGVELGILPFIFGLFATFQALKRGYILKIRRGDKIVSLPIQQLKKKQQMNLLIQFLQTNILTRNKLTLKSFREF